MSLKRLYLLDCNINLNSAAQIMYSLSNNSKLRELSLSNNNLALRSNIEKSKARDLLSNFMLSNKSLVHLILQNCEIDIRTAEFLLSTLVHRTNAMLIHTKHNPQMFDGIAMINMKYV